MGKVGQYAAASSRQSSNLTKAPQRHVSTSSVLHCIAVVFTILGLLGGIASVTMELLIYLQVPGRGNAAIRQIDVHFGMFSHTVEVIAKNGSHVFSDRQRGLIWIHSSHQISAWIACIFAFVCSLLVIGIQIALLCRTDTRRWYWMALELSLLLVIVLCLLIMIALSETQLMGLRSHHDTAGQYINQLLGPESFLPKEYAFEDTKPNENSYYMRGPLFSFWLMVVVDFLFLIALLLGVPFFIMITEQEEQRKRQLKLKQEREKAIMLRYV